MRLVHEDPNFEQLLAIVARDVGVDVGLVEKDYWVTHALWSLQQCKLALWFKGGTSLSKGFGLLQRFSEDLDLKIEPGDCPDMPPVPDWSREGKKHEAGREAYFEALERNIRVPGCKVRRGEAEDRQLLLEVEYPGRFLEHLPSVIRPFVRLEIGSARVTPAVPRDLDSWVHERVRAQGRMAEFGDNLPLGVLCIHPVVTLLEKLEAISKRFQGSKDPAEYVRHYEDASRIVSNEARLPDLPGGKPDLMRAMFASNDLKRSLMANDPAFAHSSGGSWESIERAHASNSRLHWKDQRPLGQCCELIRDWLGRNPVVLDAGWTTGRGSCEDRAEGPVFQLERERKPGLLASARERASPSPSALQSPGWCAPGGASRRPTGSARLGPYHSSKPSRERAPRRPRTASRASVPRSSRPV